MFFETFLLSQIRFLSHFFLKHIGRFVQVELGGYREVINNVLRLICRFSISHCINLIYINNYKLHLAPLRALCACRDSIQVLMKILSYRGTKACKGPLRQLAQLNHYNLPIVDTGVALSINIYAHIATVFICFSSVQKGLYFYTPLNLVF